MNKLYDMVKAHEGKVFDSGAKTFGNWLQARILEITPESLTCSFEVRPEMTNPLGTLHGGVTAGIMDEMLGAAINIIEGAPYVTVNNTIDYLYPAKGGETVVALAQVIKVGKKIANMHFELWNEDRSRMLAKGNSNLIRM